MDQMNIERLAFILLREMGHTEEGTDLIKHIRQISSEYEAAEIELRPPRKEGGIMKTPLNRR